MNIQLPRFILITTLCSLPLFSSATASQFKPGLGKSSCDNFFNKYISDKSITCSVSAFSTYFGIQGIVCEKPYGKDNYLKTIYTRVAIDNNDKIKSLKDLGKWISPDQCFNDNGKNEKNPVCDGSIMYKTKQLPFTCELDETWVHPTSTKSKK